MILVNNNIFELHTNNTSYVFYVNDINHLEHLHYGSRIEVNDDAIKSLKARSEFVIGNAISYS